ncbi:glucosaminidase domain-containing protein [Sediminibacterium sp. KACHI17]|jgi:LysM repeat protein|uniref:Peptidoglycan hydrolase n=1 Tax=Sediminibacterium sp. KACHI17 TaxID=1751071 RepID=A0AAT9GF98_9BACT
MKKIILLITFLGTVMLAAVAQTISVKERTEAYINSYKDLAIQEMLRTGVPASIKLAQGILESQFGESPLAKTANNHFGIKCKTEWTGEKTYQDDDAKGECFRVYKSPEESYRDHSDFLKTRPHYSFLFKLEPTDITGWAYGLKRAGYATNKTYPERLLRVIEDYQLNQYTIQGIAMMENKTAPVTTPTQNVTAANTVTEQPLTVATKNEPAVKNEILKSTTVKEETDTPQTELQTANTSIEKVKSTEEAEKKTTPVTEEKKTAAYPEGVFTINHTKAIHAKAGTSLLALAHQYDISLSKLFEFNELSELDILDIDRVLFIEKKQKKGASDYHEVTAGENIHEICQKEGIRMESLLEYNKLKKDSQLSAGQKLFLRSPAEINKAAGNNKRKSTK